MRRRSQASGESPGPELLRGFAPVDDAGVRVLILGSMPGQASLDASAYYAHPRNAFWPMMETLFGIEARLPYERRCQGLLAQHIALWDVLRHCRRSGSLDARISPGSMVANDFAAWFARHPQVRHICFNGRMAETSYRRLVRPGLSAALAGLPTFCLPSTSPANACVGLGPKLAAWRVLLDLTEAAAR